MVAGLDTDQTEQLIERMMVVLEQHASQRQLLSYLELADAIGMPGPHRIHRTTRLLELLMQRDAACGRPIRSALVVSRTRQRMPAPGFFEQARSLGLGAGQGDRALHQDLLAAIYSSLDRRTAD